MGWQQQELVCQYSKSNTTGMRAVLMRLAFRADRYGVCYPSMETIGKEIGLSGRRNAIPHVHRLKEIGEIYIKEGNGRTTSRYLVTIGLDREEIYHTLHNHPEMRLSHEEAHNAALEIIGKRGPATAPKYEQETRDGIVQYPVAYRDVMKPSHQIGRNHHMSHRQNGVSARPDVMKSSPQVGRKQQVPAQIITSDVMKPSHEQTINKQILNKQRTENNIAVMDRERSPPECENIFSQIPGYDDLQEKWREMKMVISEDLRLKTPDVIPKYLDTMRLLGVSQVAGERTLCFMAATSEHLLWSKERLDPFIRCAAVGVFGVPVQTHYIAER